MGGGELSGHFLKLLCIVYNFIENVLNLLVEAMQYLYLSRLV